MTLESYVKVIMGGSSGRTGGSGPPPPVGSQVAICFLSNSGTDPVQKRSNRFSGEVGTALCEIP